MMTLRLFCATDNNRLLDPKYESMEQEIFGPVLSIYVYPDHEFNETSNSVMRRISSDWFDFRN